MNDLVFSFDVGKGSLGVAVREDKDIIHADSLLIDEKIGILQDERGRRRAHKTREAHKRREEQLAELWKKIGEKPLTGARYNKESGVWVRIAGDKQLEQEFSKKETVYTSCLLRIILLEGKVELAPWQIYKALHSSIQRRGYDEHVPWKTTTDKQTDKDDKDDKKNQNNSKEFEDKLKEISADSKHHFPCYYDAYRMGLWSPNKGIIKFRIDKDTVKKARGQYITPRTMVDNEIRLLLGQASKQLPKLAAYIKDKKIDELLYGTAKEGKPPYPDKRYPAFKAHGLLAQNLPRFDNRAIGKCSLIPRLNVCRKSDGLFIRTRFLMNLVNFRYNKIKDDGEIITKSLGNKEICKIYKDKNKKWEKEKNKNPADMENQRVKVFFLTKPETKKIVKALGGEIKDRHETIEKSDKISSGRCRFSRPALAILHGAILSEEPPQKYQEKLIGDMQKMKDTSTSGTFGDHWLTLDKYKFRLYQKDLSFLSAMTDAKGHIYIPHVSLAEKYQSEGGKNEKAEIKVAINNLIASCHSPLVRHRLEVFNHQLNGLIEKHGSPSHVCLEFIRDDFAGKKRKNKYKKQAKEGKKEKENALRDLRDRFGDNISDGIIEEYRLMTEQGNECLYTGEALCIDKLNTGAYQTDHILPQSCNGPDSLYNKVLTFERKNKEKGDNLPAQWDLTRERWEDYENRVKRIIKDPKKRALLLASDLEEAQELAEKYTGLAVTGWIARLARDIVCLRMNWQPGEKDLPRNITVVSGGLVSRVSKKYKLYECLGDGNSKYVKNRDDKRHHALDAMVISYLPEWARDKKKTEFFKFPQGVNKDYFSEKLATIFPPLIARKKARVSQPFARVWDSNNKKYVMLQKGKREGDYSPTIYKDLSKNGRDGHWHTSKPGKGKEASSHGCLLIAPPQGEPSISPVIHAHDSIYHIRRRYQAQGCKVRRLQDGDWIEIKEGGKATKLGGKISIKTGDYKIYKITKNDYQITDEEGTLYKVKKKYIHDITIKLIQKGGEIDFKDFTYNNNILKVGYNLYIPQSVSANADYESDYSLLKGSYSIKSFSDKKVRIQDNTGTKYDLQSKKLANLIILTDK